MSLLKAVAEVVLNSNQVAEVVGEKPLGSVPVNCIGSFSTFSLVRS